MAAKTLFRLLCWAAWALLLAITLHAVAARGLLEAPATFLGDFGHPWRAQFYTDFSIHVLLAASWILYREGGRAAGVAVALLAVGLGALFTIPYLLVALGKAGGDPKRLLLGRHA